MIGAVNKQNKMEENLDRESFCKEVSLELSSECCGASSAEEHSRPREQQVQRPPNSKELHRFEEQKGGQYG